MSRCRSVHGEAEVARAQTGRHSREGVRRGESHILTCVASVCVETEREREKREWTGEEGGATGGRTRVSAQCAVAFPRAAKHSTPQHFCPGCRPRARPSHLIHLQTNPSGSGGSRRSGPPSACHERAPNEANEYSGPPNDPLPNHAAQHTTARTSRCARVPAAVGTSMALTLALTAPVTL